MTAGRQGLHDWTRDHFPLEMLSPRFPEMSAPPLIETGIRMRGEERFLRDVFGEKFEVYAKSVPALFPGISRLSRK